MDFNKPVSNENELMVIDFILGSITNELAAFHKNRTKVIEQGGIKLDIFQNPKSVSEYKINLLLDLQESESEILEKNKRFFEAKRQELLCKMV